MAKAGYKQADLRAHGRGPLAQKTPCAGDDGVYMVLQRRTSDNTMPGVAEESQQTDGNESYVITMHDCLWCRNQHSLRPRDTY